MGTSDQVLFFWDSTFCLFFLCTERATGFIVRYMVSIFSSIFVLC